MTGGPGGDDRLDPARVLDLFVRQDEQADRELLVVLEQLATEDPEHGRLLMARWVASDDHAAQAAGVLVLGHLALDDESARHELLDAADRLAGSRSEDVRWSVAVALGQHVRHPAAAARLVELATDVDDDVRAAAVASLSVPMDDPRQDRAMVLPVLLAAMNDPSPEVRDWATFAAGVQRDVDTPEVRVALRARLDDPGGDTAGEAAVALARRGDEVVLPVILDRLAHPGVGNLWVEAAAELGDVTLFAALNRLKVQGWQEDDPRPGLLDDALVRCSGVDPDAG